MSNYSRIPSRREVINRTDYGINRYCIPNVFHDLRHRHPAPVCILLGDLHIVNIAVKQSSFTISKFMRNGVCRGFDLFQRRLDFVFAPQLSKLPNLFLCKLLPVSVLYTFPSFILVVLRRLDTEIPGTGMNHQV